MRRLLTAAVLVAGGLASAPAATACTLDTCWFTQPVCSRVSCHICWYEPPGYQHCIT